MREKTLSDLRSLHNKIRRHPVILEMIKDCAHWPGETPLKRHNDAKLLIHKLNLLADLGFTHNNPALKPVIKKILATQHPDGPFQVDIFIPKVFGGSDKVERGWMLCDAPLILCALLALGVNENEPQIQKALNHLASQAKDNGFPCASFIPKLSGPGKREDPCPYATLVALRALSLSVKYRGSRICRTGSETLLSHWQRQKEKKMRMFGIGTDFRKLKYPYIWYDILHVVEVLSRFKWTHKDRRFNEMLNAVLSKKNENGFYTPESVWMAYKGLDFAQKKIPSTVLTSMVDRIRDRVRPKKDVTRPAER